MLDRTDFEILATTYTSVCPRKGYGENIMKFPSKNAISYGNPVSDVIAGGMRVRSQRSRKFVVQDCSVGWKIHATNKEDHFRGNTEEEMVCSGEEILGNVERGQNRGGMIICPESGVVLDDEQSLFIAKETGYHRSR
ncbi:hypothetical protein Tco_1401425 [Tanacetum coccineum]